jgi:hypothetical protein
VQQQDVDVLGLERREGFIDGAEDVLGGEIEEALRMPVLVWMKSFDRSAAERVTASPKRFSQR